MKKIEFRTPNRMLFESEFKTFNKAADLITTGTVWSNVLFSEHLDNKWTLKRAFPADYLYYLPNFIKLRIENETKNGAKVILYCLKLKRRPVAWILTDSNYKLLESCRAGCHQYAKETSVLNEALKYLTN